MQELFANRFPGKSIVEYFITQISHSKVHMRCFSQPLESEIKSMIHYCVPINCNTKRATLTSRLETNMSVKDFARTRNFADIPPFCENSQTFNSPRCCGSHLTKLFGDPKPSSEKEMYGSYIFWRLTYRKKKRSAFAQCTSCTSRIIRGI